MLPLYTYRIALVAAILSDFKVPALQWIAVMVFIAAAAHTYPYLVKTLLLTEQPNRQKQHSKQQEELGDQVRYQNVMIRTWLIGGIMVGIAASQGTHSWAGLLTGSLMICIAISLRIIVMRSDRKGQPSAAAR